MTSSKGIRYFIKKIIHKNYDNYLETFKMDRFKLNLFDLGRLEAIRIRHDNTGSFPSWFLDRIEITSENEKYIFVCKRWLSLTREDRKIERIIKEHV